MVKGKVKYVTHTLLYIYLYVLYCNVYNIQQKSPIYQFTIEYWMSWKNTVLIYDDVGKKQITFLDIFTN